MLTYDLILRIKEDGTLTQLIRSGIVSYKVTVYAKIYGRIEHLQVRRKRLNKKQLIVQVANEFGVHPTTVYRAVKLMRYPVPCNGTAPV